MMDEKQYYLLSDGQIRKVDPFSGDWTPISQDEFFESFRLREDKLVKLLGVNNKASAEILKAFHKKYNLLASESDLSFLKSCEKSDEQEPKPLTFDSEEAYLKYINSTSDPAQRCAAYLAFKQQHKK